MTISEITKRNKVRRLTYWNNQNMIKIPGIFNSMAGTFRCHLYIILNKYNYKITAEQVLHKLIAKWQNDKNCCLEVINENNSVQRNLILRQGFD